MKHISFRILTFIVSGLIFISSSPAKSEYVGTQVSVTPTVFLVERNGHLLQRFNLVIKSEMLGNYTLLIDNSSAKITVTQEQTVSYFFAPVCERESCKVSVNISDPNGQEIFDGDIEQPRPRKWKIYLSPFSHIDVGFTNSQRKILAQNIENLRVALQLIETTKDFPEDARFKFFSEVTWPIHEFLSTDKTTTEEKTNMVKALREGDVEIGGFLISHSNKFMPSEALFRSTDWALDISKLFGVPVKTACLNDLTDFSGIVKPLDSAGISYFIGGPNTSHYIVPPLFYLKPPIGDEKVLAWITPNLNGYGENFDLAMRPETPVTPSAFGEMESRLGDYLTALETDGAPPLNVRKHYDFFGAKWDYPYDVYFLPYYPPHAVDNGPQDITASELAKEWNAKWAYPKLIVANPSQFFEVAQKNFGNKIPTVRGELPGYWGEQIFFAMAQVDPEKETVQREFERNANLYERAAVAAMLKGEQVTDLSEEIARGYKLIALNNDHNPAPVPFGHTNYTKDDVAEWKRTRRDWIAEISRISDMLHVKAAEMTGDMEVNEASTPASASEDADTITIENEYYKVIVDKKTGGISSLYDKELRRELAANDGKYLLNQYVAVARGEDVGIRGNVFHRAGFKRVNVTLESGGGASAIVKVTGQVENNSDAVEALKKFVKHALGINVPGFLIRGGASFFDIKPGPLASVTQTIEIKRSIKAVYFTQEIKTEREQMIAHVFAYPFNVAKVTPIAIDGQYNPYTFSPASPLGNGDMIPAAKMLDDQFPGINDLTKVFEWIYGMPADAVFRRYSIVSGDGFGIAFSSKDSGAIFPGSIDKDPVRGPFGGTFYHLALGWSAYGRAFLGSRSRGGFKIESALTSFASSNSADSRVEAEKFANDFLYGSGVETPVRSSNPEIAIVAFRPLDNNTFMMRLQDISGKGGQTSIVLPENVSISSAGYCRSDGESKNSGSLAHEKNKISIRLKPGEVANIAVNIR